MTLLYIILGVLSYLLISRSIITFFFLKKEEDKNRTIFYSHSYRRGGDDEVLVFFLLMTPEFLLPIYLSWKTATLWINQVLKTQTKTKNLIKTYADKRLARLSNQNGEISLATHTGGELSTTQGD